MSEFLSLEDLTLAYGGSVAVDRLNLAIRQGELIAHLDLVPLCLVHGVRDDVAVV